MSYIVPQKMPLRCFECDHISSSTMDGYSCKTAHKSLVSEHGINIRRPDWCPLIEIKTPHGRLGDLDELIEKYGEWYTEEGTESGYIGTMKNLLDGASTVIEAED